MQVEIQRFFQIYTPQTPNPITRRRLAMKKSNAHTIAWSGSHLIRMFTRKGHSIARRVLLDYPPGCAQKEGAGLLPDALVKIIFPARLRAGRHHTFSPTDQFSPLYNYAKIKSVFVATP